LNPPSGCAFHGRCRFANERCKSETPVLKLDSYDESEQGHLIACHAVEENRINLAEEVA